VGASERGIVCRRRRRRRLPARWGREHKRSRVFFASLGVVPSRAFKEVFLLSPVAYSVWAGMGIGTAGGRLGATLS